MSKRQDLSLIRGMVTVSEESDAHLDVGKLNIFRLPAGLTPSQEVYALPARGGEPARALRRNIELKILDTVAGAGAVARTMLFDVMRVSVPVCILGVIRKL